LIARLFRLGVIAASHTICPTCFAGLARGLRYTGL
jgi:hypothetical protein